MTSREKYVSVSCVSKLEIVWRNNEDVFCLLDKENAFLTSFLIIMSVKHKRLFFSSQLQYNHFAFDMY